MLSVDSVGNIYVSTGLNNVQKLSPSGDLLATISSGVAGGASFDRPFGITISNT